MCPDQIDRQSPGSLGWATIEVEEDIERLSACAGQST
jgi:hypothetical protein